MRKYLKVKAELVGEREMDNKGEGKKISLKKFLETSK